LGHHHTRRLLFYVGGVFIFCLQASSVWPRVFEAASGEKPAVSISKDKVFYSQQANPQEWGEWFADKKSYIQQTTALFRKAARIAREQGKKIQKAAYTYDAQRLATMKKNAHKAISRIIGELQKLAPPDEMKLYHDNIIQSCQIMQNIIDAYGNGGSLYAAYTLNSVTLAMDAVKSLKELYAQHGASQEDMDGLADMVLDSFLKM